MVAAAGDRIDGWWSRKATIADSRRARVLVFMQSVGFQIERNGARKKPRASTLKYALDNAVVVIEGMTKIKTRDAGLKASTTLNRFFPADSESVPFKKSEAIELL